MEERYEELKKLIETYKRFKKESDSSAMSEETSRMWLNDLLGIFGWDVHNTTQVIQEKVVDKSQKTKLEEIESSHTKPDYALVNGRTVKSYLDAKKADIDIFKDKDAAFQVRSYGWSAGVPCAFLSNFEQFVIFDCQILPQKDMNADIGAIQLAMDDYLNSYDILKEHLDRFSVYQNKLEKLYSIHKTEGNKTVDRYFNELLSQFRLRLANEMYSGNRKINLCEEELNYYVQIIIDRIIFIRVCETRGLEKKELLKQFAETDFWGNFKESCYTQFHEHYDGPMFSNTDKRFRELEIDNQVFAEFIEKLYYPYPYRFDVIPVEVIAKVYEEFLAYSLVVSDEQVVVELKEEYVKTNGVIPTNEKIAEAICKETINVSVIKTIDDMWSTYVLDPCCGSGIFLVTVYERLSSRLKELAIDSDNELCACYEGEKYLTIDAKQKLMSSCLYGIDIDPLSVEVTKMSLALKIIEDANPVLYTETGMFGEKILKDIDRNIVCGNTLINTDIELPIDEITAIKPTDIENEMFGDVFKNAGGFSYIVGNPPYVETKYFKAASLAMHQYLRNNYDSFQGKADLAVLFVERCIDLLASDGQLGFIIQRRWFKTTYGKNARNFITHNGYLKKLLDIETTNLFPGRITYVSIMTLQKRQCMEVEYAYIPGDKYDVVSYFDKEQRRKSIPKTYFEGEIWAPEFYDTYVIKNKYAESEGTIKNNQRIHMRDGIQVLWKKIFHLTNCTEEEDCIVGVNGFGDSVRIEKGIVKPVIYNKVFLPLKKLHADAYCIFPYKGEHFKEKISITEMEQYFPKAYKYLKDNEEKIKKKVKHRKGEYWHTYTRVQNHKWFEGKKIVLPMTSIDTVASYESEKGFYMDNANVWFMTIDEGEDVEYKAMTMIINSTIFSVFAKSGANPQSGGYYKFNRQFLEPVPFPNNRFHKNDVIIRQLAENYDSITELIDRYENAIEQNKIHFMKMLTAKWNKVDALCNDLYGLAEADWDEIKKVGRKLNRVTGEKVCNESGNEKAAKKIQ